MFGVVVGCGFIQKPPRKKTPEISWIAPSLVILERFFPSQFQMIRESFILGSEQRNGEIYNRTRAAPALGKSP